MKKMTRRSKWEGCKTMEHHNRRATTYHSIKNNSDFIELYDICISMYGKKVPSDMDT
jgi:hypothetical protein